MLVYGIGEKKCWITSRNQIAGLASPGTTTYILNVCTHGEQLNSIGNSKRRERKKKALSNVAEAIKVTRCYNKWLAMNGPPLHKQLRLYSFCLFSFPSFSLSFFLPLFLFLFLFICKEYYKHTYTQVSSFFLRSFSLTFFLFYFKIYKEE